jgi:hypothetical protein
MVMQIRPRERRGPRPRRKKRVLNAASSTWLEDGDEELETGGPFILGAGGRKVFTVLMAFDVLMPSESLRSRRFQPAENCA